MTSATAPRFHRDKLNVFPSPQDMKRVSHALRSVGRKVALVPTMGALHDGHLELIRRAKRLPNIVVGVSIFVNPLQFSEGEDFEAYPRSLSEDLAKLTEAGVQFAFSPATTDLYRDNAAVTIHPGLLGEELEGAHRPNHFSGVLTIVSKLLNIVRPDFAFFGEK